MGDGRPRVGASEIATILRKAYEGLAAGDPSAVLSSFAAEGVLHIENGTFGGDYVGPEAIAGVLAGLFEWTGGTLRLDVEEIFTDEKHGVALVRETGRRARDGVELDVRETHLLHIENGLVVDFWDLPAIAGRDAHDAFFSETR
jgi:ketosteroid isomerase-like protein